MCQICLSALTQILELKIKCLQLLFVFFNIFNDIMLVHVHVFVETKILLIVWIQSSALHYYQPSFEFCIVVAINSLALAYCNISITYVKILTILTAGGGIG